MSLEAVTKDMRGLEVTHKRYYTPPQIAELLGVSHDKVLVWIRSGELSAINLATCLGERPRWHIAPADLDSFLEARRTRQKAESKRRRRLPSQVTEFY